MTDGDDAWRKRWLYHYNYEKQFPYTPNVRGVRTDRWKYMRYPHGDGTPDRHMAELYDVQNDPEERHNLINDPDHAQIVQQMQQELLAALSDVGLTPETDHMPLDEGIKAELPEESIR